MSTTDCDVIGIDVVLPAIKPLTVTLSLSPVDTCISGLASRLSVNICRAAIEEIFKVKVASVNVLTTKSKEKRGGMRRSRVGGRTTPWRKAIVTLAPGQKIEFFEAV